MHGYLEARCWREPGSRLLLVIFTLSAFCQRFLVQMSVGQTQIIPFLLTKNPQAHISPAKLCSTARVRNPQGISIPCYKILCNGFLNVPLPYGIHPQSVPRDIISWSNCCPQQLRSAMDVLHDSWG
jgi:hypothetical protein